MLRVLLLGLLGAGSACACLWDRDTLAEEAKGRPDTVMVIAGWFAPHPPRYYEMRLERVAREIDGGARAPGLFDDAAVACDRLGRHDEAIGWMQRKKEVLDAMPAAEVKEHRYRYLANMGTFIAHRWVSQPAEVRSADVAPLREAEQWIAGAIEENPDAHFGREVYQLMAIRWLLDELPGGDPEALSLWRDKDIWIDSRWPRGDPEAQEHIAGIVGLIQLGAAWKSLDVFHTLTAALNGARHASLAELSYHRELELYGQGARSIHPLAGVAEAVVPTPSQFLEEPLRGMVADYYPQARDAAKQRVGAWLAYQEARFDRGMHPDTHPEFWAGWVEPELPAFPDLPAPTQFFRWLESYIQSSIPAALSVLLVATVLTVVVVRLAFRPFRRAAGCRTD